MSNEHRYRRDRVCTDFPRSDKPVITELALAQIMNGVMVAPRPIADTTPSQEYALFVANRMASERAFWRKPDAPRRDIKD
jgi:hypothetical protein